MPTAVLFNGGVFKAGPIRARVLDLLASWNGGQAVRELEGFEPDLAVAQGAAIYGQHRATGCVYLLSLDPLGISIGLALPLVL
jgi:hypothetical protein